MKKILIGMLLLFSGIMVFSQPGTGLQGLVVEKYYQASAADASADGASPQITAGAITYRIYIDMAPGYKLQALYGNASHELFIQTTTSFYNNNDRGEAVANSIQASRLATRAVALDSWLSLGAASDGHLGVQKTGDSNGSILTSYTNNAPGIGPLNVVDGLITGTPAPVTLVPDATIVNSFFGASASGPRFSLTNGAWSNASGVTEAINNTVLVAQITTTGDISLEFNVQLLSPTSVVEKYVPRNAVALDGEFNFPGLSYTSYVAPNTPPSITLNYPNSNGTANLNEELTFDATATDGDGNVTGVVFYVDPVAAGATVQLPGNNVPPSTQWSSDWTATPEGQYDIYAIATDDDGATTQSATWRLTIVDPNIAPTVSITEPLAGASIDISGGNSVTISATAVDPDPALSGGISSVVFDVDGVQVGVPVTTPPYSVTWLASVGDDQVITATATDGLGKQTAAQITVDVVDSRVNYTLGSNISVPCYASGVFCLPLIRVNTPLVSVNGFDVKIEFEPDKVTPTGVVAVNDAMVNRDYTSYAMRLENDSTILLSVFLNGSAPISTFFNGLGQVFCVEFARNASFTAGTIAEFSMPEIRESYLLTTALANSPDPVTYTTFIDPIFHARLQFWADNSPIKGPVADGYHLTQFGNQAGTYFVEPDANGNVAYNFITGGPSVMILKDIDNAASFGGIIFNLFGGYDAYLTARVLVDDPSFTPNVFQIIAMDVNNDGRVAAGDLSQINQRAVEIRKQFEMVDNAGAPMSIGLDWKWLSNEALLTEARYRISNAYPNAGTNGGYYKGNVPKVSFNYGIDLGYDPLCPVTEQETFTAILIGDVDGSYKNLASPTTGLKKTEVSSDIRNNVNGQKKSTEASETKLIFDFAGAKVSDGYVDIPVFVKSDMVIHSVDFSLEYNNQSLSLSSVISHNEQIYTLFNNLNGNNVMFTSYSMNRYQTDVKLFSVRFSAPNGIKPEDLLEMSAFINGSSVIAELNVGSEIEIITDIRIYPNPTVDKLNIDLIEEASIHIMDIHGRIVKSQANLSANTTHEINVGELPNGHYFMKIYNSHFVVIKKFVIEK